MTTDIAKRRREVEVLRLKADPLAETPRATMTKRQAEAMVEAAAMAKSLGLTPWLADEPPKKGPPVHHVPLSPVKWIRY